MAAQGYGVKSTTNPGVTWFEQKFDECAVAQAGSVHRGILTSLGRVVPDSITADHQGNAVLSFRVIPIKKTGVDIVAITDNNALPSITITSARWTLGKCTIDSNVLTGKLSYRINFGNTADGRGADSDLDDTFLEATEHAPSIEIRGIDSSWFTTFGLDGVALAHADTILYLRKRSQDSSNFVADGTAEHIKFTMFGLGAMDDIAAGGEVTRPTEDSLMITGAVDSSGNNPLILDTASAIT